MNRLRERALFFGAGLLFGAVLGFLFAGERGTPAAPFNPPSQTTGSASQAPPTATSTPQPPLAPPIPLDSEQLEALLAEVNANPEDAAARAAVGNLYLESREFSDAVYWLQQARNLDPTDHDVRSRLAFAQFAQGDVAASIAGYEAILNEDPNHFPSLLALGRLKLFVEQDLPAGIALWERAIAAAPNSADAAALRTELEALRTAHPG